VGYILPSRRLTTLSPTRTISGKRRTPKRRKDTTARDLRIVVGALDAYKAIDLVVLDVREVSDVADYFVIASGSSDTHVRTLAERVTEATTEHGRRPHHVEGVSAGRWALLDFVDIVVHVFHPTLRAYYQLERLWSDAPTVSFEEAG
jgi:ribosome-associated protein